MLRGSPIPSQRITCCSRNGYPFAKEAPMAPRSSRILTLGVATLVVLLSISGLAVAQTDDASGPTTSRSSETAVLADTFDDPESGIIPPFQGASDDFSAEYDSGFFDIDALADD